MQPANQLPEKEARFCSQRDEMNVCLASLAGQTWIFPIKKGRENKKKMRSWRLEGGERHNASQMHLV